MISRPKSYHFNDRNNYEAIYHNVQMFQPINHIEYNHESVNASEMSNVMVQIQLIDYINQGLRLPKGQTCVCPSEFSCSYLGTSVPRCYMSFTVILLSSDESVKYFSTEFMPLTSSGNIDIDSMSPQQKQAWQQPHTFYLTSKPSTIDVFVHHMGVVINADTGELTQIQTVVHVDTFILPLNPVIPSIGNGYLSMQSENLNGVILQTQLTVAYSIQCKGTLIGRNCDLICNEAAANTAIAVCQSNITNFFYTCTYMENGQVQNCLPCPWGITQESFCQNSSGGILSPSAADVVPSGFKVATIVLGILVGILLIILALLIIYSIMMGRRMRGSVHSYNNTIPGHNYRSTLRSEGNANRPLLQSTNNELHNQIRRAPTAAPRSTPKLDALPAKSSLRKAVPLPSAQFSGVPSLNDTLNSTLSSVPLPPSKEADV
uniref:Transmembrane domain-containing protein n=1 Tax=Elaeophora elaphi TaxID=1147741 RepID=A0A0R3RZI2_9BILA